MALKEQVKARYGVSDLVSAQKKTKKLAISTSE